MTTTQTPRTITTIDQNSRREIVWTVESANEHPRATPNGYTHFCIVTRHGGTQHPRRHRGWHRGPPLDRPEDLTWP
jgi:hypothetical protein